MAAKSTQAQMFAADIPAIQSAVGATLQAMAVKDVAWLPNGLQVSCKTHAGMQSWGEKVTVSITPAGEVRVWSECAMPTQIVDWGKNGQNCQQILGGIASRLYAATAPAYPASAPVAIPYTTPAVAAGWYPDPAGRHEQRYWDGSAWTEHIADAGTAGSDPL